MKPAKRIAGIDYTGFQVLEVAARHRGEKVLWRLAAMREPRLREHRRLKRLRNGVTSVVRGLLRLGYLEGDERMSSITKAGRDAIVAFRTPKVMDLEVGNYSTVCLCLDCGNWFPVNRKVAVRAGFACGRCGSRNVDAQLPLAPEDCPDGMLYVPGDRRRAKCPRSVRNADKMKVSDQEPE